MKIILTDSELTNILCEYLRQRFTLFAVYVQDGKVVLDAESNPKFGGDRLGDKMPKYEVKGKSIN